MPWMRTHAANPAVESLSGGRVRIYFSTRDALNRSHIAAAVFELQPAPRLLELSPQPLVAPGPPGAFDDSGTSMGSLLAAEGTLWLYYLGWNLGVTVPWRNSIGLAVSRDGGRSFAKHSAAPVMDRHALDPFSLSYPWVMREGAAWRMWYGSNLRWGATERDMDHVLKHARSTDGIAWERDGRPLLPFAQPGEFAHARPCVIRDPDCYRMWFAQRGERYQLGHAESEDGMNWRRLDRACVFDDGPAGWDEGTRTYPCVFDHAGARYLVYNGNGYGKTGFGLAVME
jgi:hypothetical protein